MVGYVTGDATRPHGTHEGMHVVAHVVNDRGVWGRGFVQALGQRWPHVKQDYLVWHARELGKVRLTPVCAGLMVAHLCAQEGVRSAENPVPLRYEALHTCVQRLAQTAKHLGATVHMPRIGTGLAGGSWEHIGPMLENTLTGIRVIVYDLPATVAP